MSKHTPGPWVFAPPIGAEHAEVRDRDGRRIAVTIGSYPIRTKTEDANARLIAAALELLEALEELHMLIDDAHDGERIYTIEVQKKVKAIIAKAKGES